MKAILTLPPFPDDEIPTLGLAICEWIEEWLLQPDGDDAGTPFRLTAEQIRFVKWFYALDANGRFRYRRGVLRRAKGWGKSPFLGALCLAELCGPVRFSHWDEDGDPVGQRHPMPWVVVAGVSETQTENTLGAIRAMAQDSALVDEVGLDVGLTRIFVPGGGKLVAITASSSTQEGARPSFAVMDETHHWTKGNGGQGLARVIRRNLAKSRDGAARVIETTNAHEPSGGDSAESVAEASYNAFQKQKEGRTRRQEILYDSREAPALSTEQMADEDTLREALRVTYGGSTWVDLDSFIGEIYDPDTPVEEARRFYLNQIVAAADAWLAPHEYDANFVADLDPLKPGETVTLGFDGALTDDASALVAVRVSDGAPFLLGLWEKGTQFDTEIDKGIVRDLVDHTFATYDVVAFFSDVAYWETDVDNWRDTYGEQLLVKATTRHAVGWDMRGHASDTVRAVMTLHRAYIDGQVPHNGDDRLRRHVLNARRRPNRWGVSFGKDSRESKHKVDALAALVLARMARSRILAENVLSKRRGRTGRLYGFR